VANDIDIIIISYNCAALTLKCIESIFKTHETARVTIIDNASTDNSSQIIREKFPEIQMIENKENRGYAGAVNIGMNATSAEFAIISNADVEYFKNSIETLKNVLKDNPRVGAVGPQQVFPDGRWQRSYGMPPGLGEAVRDIFLITYLDYAFKRFMWKIAPDGFKKGGSFKKVKYIGYSQNTQKTRVRTKRPEFIATMENQLDEVVNLFQTDDFMEDRKLSGEFLLGYHCQRQTFRTKPETEQDESIEAIAVETN